MKGLVFAGCSFTWGQGLYYYSDLKNLDKANDNIYENSTISYSHIKYMESKRFSRLVANEFDTFDIVKKDNGGSDEASIEFLDELFGFLDSEYHIKYTIPTDDIEYIIFQTTVPLRSGFYYKHKKKK